MKSQEDAEVEKRLLLAILLSMAILFLTPYVYRYFVPEPVETLGTEQQQAAEKTIPVRPAEVTQREERLEPAPVTPAPPAASGVPETEEVVPREIVLENPDLRLRFSNIGGSLISAEIKGLAKEEELEILPQETEDLIERPLLLSLDGGTTFLSDTGFEVEERSESGGQSIVFRYRREGLEIEKSIHMPPSGYELLLTVRAMENGGAKPVWMVLGPGIGPVLSENGRNSDFRDPSVAYFVNDTVERYDAGDLEEGAVQMEIRPRWVAMDSKYFCYLLIGPSALQGVRLEQLVIQPPTPSGGEEMNPVSLVNAVVGVRSGEDLKLYVGPKQGEALKAADASLGRLINYGWFGIIVRPLLTVLKFIHRYVNNYGWSIIILTFLINLALFPVRYKQMASMRKMSALQPQLKSIQDKYKRMKKDDPRKQQMNAEVMALYKEHGVNPLGGCLPLLAQMPILFAFYRMLDMAFELRGAPFIFWIQDLSKMDPYYITPVVMGITMVVQQKMTPATGDPSQRKMMMLMPVVFTFFFLGVSSGLALYFLFSNLFGMGFQVLTQKLRPELAKQPGKKPWEGKSKK